MDNREFDNQRRFESEKEKDERESLERRLALIDKIPAGRYLFKNPDVKPFTGPFLPSINKLTKDDWKYFVEFDINQFTYREFPYMIIGLSICKFVHSKMPFKNYKMASFVSAITGLMVGSLTWGQKVRGQSSMSSNQMSGIE